ncbi:hypothetical protein GCM10009416_49150 [Craurococcus roseus]|uniref:Uncharacterized protein n=1 Tax=Craurococcus roseus TaxID=77585 RepID=A0ABP3R9B9_9PROT
MRSQALEHCVLGLTALVTLIWLDLLPTAMLQEAAMVLLAWAVFSTLLVASAGAWVAFARARARAGARSGHRQHLTRQS